MGTRTVRTDRRVDSLDADAESVVTEVVEASPKATSGKADDSVRIGARCAFGTTCTERPNRSGYCQTHRPLCATEGCKDAIAGRSRYCGVHRAESRARWKARISDSAAEAAANAERNDDAYGIAMAAGKATPRAGTEAAIVSPKGSGSFARYLRKRWADPKGQKPTVMDTCLAKAIAFRDALPEELRSDIAISLP